MAGLARPFRFGFVSHFGDHPRFVADHVEILFDVDIELRELGDSLGVTVTRTPSLGTDPELIAALTPVLGPDLTRTPFLHDYGLWNDPAVGGERTDAEP